MLLFLDFSGGEFFLIAIVFLVFFGSKSVPGMARTLGKAVREFKDAANAVQREIHESIADEPANKQLNPPATSLPATPGKENDKKEEQKPPV